MRIRKIEEVKLNNGAIDHILSYHLMLAEKDEGWELTKEEMKELIYLIKDVMRESSKPEDQYIEQLEKEVKERGMIIDRVNERNDQAKTDKQILLDKVKRLEKKLEEITSIELGVPRGDLTATITAGKLRCADGLSISDIKIEKFEERKCRICGCTQNNACEGGCYWTEIDLCSKCMDKINVKEVVEAEKEIFREQNYDFPRIKRERRDYTKYIKMYRDGAEQKAIEQSMVKDFGITPATATNNYYSNVRAKALKEIEDEKIVIVDENKPAPGKFFTDGERKRIQEAARIK